MRHVRSGKCDLPVTSTFPFAFHTSFMLEVVVVVDWYGRSKIKMFTGLTQLLCGFTHFLQAGLGKGLDKAAVTSLQFSIYLTILHYTV